MVGRNSRNGWRTDGARSRPCWGEWDTGEVVGCQEGCSESRSHVTPALIG